MIDIYLKVSVDDPEYYCCGDETTASVICPEDILDKINNATLESYGYLRIKQDTTKGITVSPKLKELLKRQGWIHSSEILNREDRKKLEQKYYLKRSRYSNLDIIDVDDLRSPEIKDLADGAEIVQVVDTKTILSSRDYKKIQDIKKKKEEESKKRAERKKKREIEKAKKILEEAKNSN